jgi:uncharacterized protein YjbI with pentapeptide repeats
VLVTKETYDRIVDEPRQRFTFSVPDDDKVAHAMRPGNRVVLTASQHGFANEGVRTGRTFVTVATLQRFASDQDRIGRRDCSDVAVSPDAQLDRCDLVGAYLDRALVSTRTTKTGMSTKLRLADLTGATMRNADLSGANLSGGRINGADATRAVFDNTFLAGTEGDGLIADFAVSDISDRSSGGNMFDAHMVDAHFHGARFNGVSLNHARLDHSDFTGATLTALDGSTARFVDANLSGAIVSMPAVNYADFTDADLTHTAFTPLDLQWATLCRTQLPDGSIEKRDCKKAVDPGPSPAPDPLVVVKTRLRREGDQAKVTGTIRWNADSITSYRMTQGDIRLLAIDGSTGRPTPLASQTLEQLPASGITDLPEKPFTITKPELLRAMEGGNRIVLTATQHPPRLRTMNTQRSYVAVDTLQPGPGRGRVGDTDCSNRPLTKPADGAGYDFCDLPGAALAGADLGGPMRMADLTGAELGKAGLDTVFFDASAMGGVTARGASMGGVTMTQVHAPLFDAANTPIRGGAWRAEDFDEANFTGATITDTTFATAPMRRAKLTGATLNHVDLGFTRMAGGHLENVIADRDPNHPSTLYLSDLTSATLEGSRWNKDESGTDPWQWATLCSTTMPPGNVENRDCPRS